ncbi:hypothetical protein B0J17DRAFT_630122 [Rhizoctonia solani]|nr:hypothetical protein B0J17DRAFT_630122 [Rhizoctonia solani]
MKEAGKLAWKPKEQFILLFLLHLLALGPTVYLSQQDMLKKLLRALVSPSPATIYKSLYGGKLPTFVYNTEKTPSSWTPIELEKTNTGEVPTTSTYLINIHKGDNDNYKWSLLQPINTGYQMLQAAFSLEHAPAVATDALVTSSEPEALESNKESGMHTNQYYCLLFWEIPVIGWRGGESNQLQVQTMQVLWQGLFEVVLLHTRPKEISS